MARYVHLTVAYDDDWTAGSVFRPAGVLAGWISLRVRGVPVLGGQLTGLNAAALALARAALGEHRPGGVPDEAPLFPCPSALHPACAAAADFAVAHAGRELVLTSFAGCLVAPDACFRVPWEAWARATLRLGDGVVRRARPDHPGIDEAHRAAYVEARTTLRELLRPIRRRLREAAR